MLLLLPSAAGCTNTTATADAALDAPEASAPEASAPEASLADAGADGESPAQLLARVGRALTGDFDNSTQYRRQGGKLVERHVCPLPGRAADPSVLWLYVEHVEVLSARLGDGGLRRDAYFTRVNEVRIVGGVPVSRAYRFRAGHPLYTSPATFNGPRDGCLMPGLLGTVQDSDLEYRAGCDVTFADNGDGTFHATTMEGTCGFPGGYIVTDATVFMNGLDTSDTPYLGGVPQPVDTFEFRRLP